MEIPRETRVINRNQNGKGSWPTRNINKKFRENFELIDWGKTKPKEKGAQFLIGSTICNFNP